MDLFKVNALFIYLINRLKSQSASFLLRYTYLYLFKLMQSSVWTEQCMLYLSTLKKPFGIPMDSPASVEHLPETGYHNLVSLWQIWVLINTSQPAYWAFCSEYRSELRMYHVSCTFLSRDWVLRNVREKKGHDLNSKTPGLFSYPTLTDINISSRR